MVDPMAEQQELFRQQMQLLAKLGEQANQYAGARQTQANEAAGAYQQAAAQPVNLAPPPAAMLGNTMAAVGGVLAHDPNYMAQADATIRDRQSQLLQQRMQVLGSMHDQALSAAEQARNAGDMAASMRFTQQALAANTQLAQSMENLRQLQQENFQFSLEGQRQAFETRNTQFVQGQENFRQRLSLLANYTMNDPILRAQTDDLGRAYASQMSEIGQQIAMVSMQRPNKQSQERLDRLTALRDQTQKAYDDRIQMLEQQVRGAKGALFPQLGGNAPPAPPAPAEKPAATPAAAAPAPKAPGFMSRLAGAFMPPEPPESMYAKSLVSQHPTALPRDWAPILQDPKLQAAMKQRGLDPAKVMKEIRSHTLLQRAVFGMAGPAAK